MMDAIFTGAGRHHKDGGGRTFTELDRKIKEMESMRKTLAHLVRSYQGDHQPDCPILQDLEGATPAAPRRARKSA